MVYKLLIKCDKSSREFYENHSTYHEGDSGLDLFVPDDVTVSPGETVFVDLGVRCEMLYCDGGDCRNISYLMYPRSSLSKTPLMLANHVGVIDAGYRGNIKAAFRSLDTKQPYTIKRGTRLVQLCTPMLEPFSFKLVDSLSTSTRGQGGFGSTGV